MVVLFDFTLNNDPKDRFYKHVMKVMATQNGFSQISGKLKFVCGCGCSMTDAVLDVDKKLKDAVAAVAKLENIDLSLATVHYTVE